MLSHRAVVYHYSDHRDSLTAKDLLGDTSGYLTSDGYSAYGCLEGKSANRTAVGCWGHQRRKLWEAKASVPQVADVLALITKLYRIEHKAERDGVKGTEEHLRRRNKQSRPILNEIWAWVDAFAGKHSPKSKIHEALTYATTQRQKLERFLDDVNLDLDNNVSERALRIIALGRKNSLFAGHGEAAQNLAVMHSIVSTCRLHDVNPYEYIKDVLVRIQSHPASRIAELLPWNWRPPSNDADASRTR